MKYKYLISFSCCEGSGNTIWESDRKIDEEEICAIRNQIAKDVTINQGIIILNIIKLEENDDN